MLKEKLKRQRRKGLISSLDHFIEQWNRSKCELQLQELLQATDRLFIKLLRQDAPQISFAGFKWKTCPRSVWGKSNCRGVLLSFTSIFIFTLYFVWAGFFHWTLVIPKYTMHKWPNNNIFLNIAHQCNRYTSCHVHRMIPQGD